MKKHLVKVGNEMRILSEDNIVMFPILDGLSKEDIYNEWGMDNLTGFSQGVTNLSYEMEFVGELETGRVSKQTIDKSDIEIQGISII